MDLTELENEYRGNWNGYQPSRLQNFLAKVADEERVELLTRMISAELEFLYTPPVVLEPPGEDEDERAKPNLQLFMLQFSELRNHVNAVFRLSVLDYALRLKNERIRPNPDSYLSFCERSQERLMDLLRRTETTLVRPRSVDEPPARAGDSTIQESGSLQALPMEPLPTNLGCFLLVEQVGRGGMGFVHNAIDLRSTAPVAVKVMRRIDPWSISRFYEEFSWLSQINHPNLVKLYDAFAEGDIRYFSMELVEGRTAKEWFERKRNRSKKGVPWDSLRKVLGQAASAVHFLHEHGVLHCDIKCSNLMIAARRRAVLLDLGLAAREGNDSSYQGTVQYMAPEVVASQNRLRASDWYSFGAMLLEIMTGEILPVEEDRQASEDFDRPVYRTQAAAIDKALEGCDPALASLCRDLLAEDPHHRPGGLEVLERLGAEYFSGNQFDEVMGREQEVEELNGVYEAIQESEAKPIVVVSGESGVGKSTTVRKWLSQVDKQADLQLTLNCFRQDHTPLRLINLFIQELAHVISSVDEAVWKPSLESRRADIRRAFPQLLQATDEGMMFDKPPPTPLSPHVVKAKGLENLREWLIEISQKQRMLIVIDDVQWADDESLNWVAELITAPDFNGMLIAIDEPSVEHQESSVLERMASFQQSMYEIEILPLSSSVCEALLELWCESEAIKMTPNIRASIVSRCEGIPFLLQELFRVYAHYAKRDRISESDWIADSSHNNTKRRFGTLNIQSENVLQYLAVADRPISFYQLQGLSRIRPDELQRTLNLLASQGWIRSRTREMDTSVVISHAKFRNIVLESMPAERLQRRHFRTARTLSAEVPPPWPRMAFHYFAAERFREGAACYSEAARVAFRQSHFADTLEYLEKADHPAAERSPREESELRFLKANSLAAQGKADAAALIFDDLERSSEDEDQRLVRRCLSGDQFIRAGELNEGLKRLEEVLIRIGLRRNRSGQSGWALRGKILALASLRPGASIAPVDATNFVPLSPLEECLMRTALPLAFLDNQLGPALILHMKRVTNTRGSLADLAIARLYWATLLSLGLRSWRKAAAPWMRLGSQLAKRSGDPRALGMMHLCLTLWHILRGRFLRAITHYEAGYRWFSKDPHNMHWELHFLRWLVTDCYWYSMQLENLCEMSCELQEASHSPVSEFLSNIGACHWCLLVFDKVEAAEEALANTDKIVSQYEFQPPWFFLWIARVNQLLYKGDSLAALRLLKSNWRKLTKSYVLETEKTKWQILCLRMSCLLGCMRDDPLRLKAYRQDMKRCLRQLRKLNEIVFRSYAEAFEIVLQDFMASDQSGLAQSDWSAAIGILESQNQLLYANALRWKFGCRFGNEAVVEQAKAAFEERGVVDPRRLMNILFPLADWKPEPSS